MGLRSVLTLDYKRHPLTAGCFVLETLSVLSTQNWTYNLTKEYEDPPTAAPSWVTVDETAPPRQGISLPANLSLLV